MIIIGYPGIGKSTLAKKKMEYIDLESCAFMVDGVRSANWHNVYVQIAKHLSEQGYTVFVSSHAVVREALNGIGVPVGACYPAIEMKDAWIDRLQRRYDESQTAKDYRALMNAKESFEQNIIAFGEDCDRYGFQKFVIDYMDYELETVVLPKEKRHDSHCIRLFDHCPCITCKKDSDRCCMKHGRLCESDAPCPDYKQEVE